MAESDTVCGSDRFLVLHYNAHQRQLKREEVLAQIEEFEYSHFYRPRITKKAHDIVARAQQRVASPDFLVSRPAHDRLYQEAEVRKVNRQVLEREVLRGCTFQEMVLPFSERLYPNEHEQRERRILRERARVREETKGCTFTPQLTRNRGFELSLAEQRAMSPVYERLNKYHSAQQLRLEMLREIKGKKDLEGATFQPILTATAGRRRRSPSPPARRRQEDEDDDEEEEGSEQEEAEDRDLTVFERLAACRRRARQGANHECTFKPELESAKYTRENVMEGMSMPERFERYNAYKEARRARRVKEKEMEEKKAYTFKPTVNPPRHKVRRRSPPPAAAAAAAADDNDGDPWAIAEAAAATGAQMQMTTTERLSESARNRVQAREKAKEEMELGGCTFRPKINHRTSKAGRGRAMKREGPLVSRLLEAGEEAKKRQQEKRKDKEKKEMEQCTFQPSLEPTARYKSPPRSSSAFGQGPRRWRSMSPEMKRRGSRSSRGSRSPPPVAAARRKSIVGVAGPPAPREAVWRKPVVAAVAAAHSTASQHSWTGSRRRSEVHNSAMYTPQAWVPEHLRHHQERMMRRGSSPGRMERRTSSSSSSFSSRRQHNSCSPPRRGSSILSLSAAPLPPPPPVIREEEEEDQEEEEEGAPPPALPAPSSPAPLTVALEDEESLRQELDALPMPEDTYMDPMAGGGGDGRGGMLSRASSLGSAGCSRSEGILPPGERLRRFQHWRRALEKKIEGL